MLAAIVNSSPGITSPGIIATSVAGEVPNVHRWMGMEVIPDNDRIVVIHSPRGASIEAWYCHTRESFIVEDFNGEDVCVSTSMWREA